MDTNLLERGNPITLRELIENSSEESTIILSVHQGYTGLQWDTYVLESHQKERLLDGSGYEIQIDTGDEIITAVIPSAEMLGQQVSNVSVQEDGKIHASIKWWEPLEEKAVNIDKNTFSIYQLKRGDETLDFRFEPLDSIHRNGLSVDPANYDLIYTASLAPDMSLDDIFTRFNIDRPADFKGHSLSVSDVIVLHQDGQDTAHYVDSIGFQEVPEFFREITPDARMTGEQIRTPRGSFHVTDMTREQMEAAGYGFHHQSEDGKYLIMGNGTDVYAVSATPKEAQQSLYKVEYDINGTGGIAVLKAKDQKTAAAYFAEQEPEASILLVMEDPTSTDTPKEVPNDWKIPVVDSKHTLSQAEIDLVSIWESENGKTLSADRYTEWFGDYGMNVLKHGTPIWKVESRLRNALDDMAISRQELNENAGINGRYNSPGKIRKVFQLRSSLPGRCYVYVQSTDEIGIVKCGKMGYYPTDRKPIDGLSGQETVNLLNEQEGVTRAEASAMNAGSLFGWDIPAANPQNYDIEGKPIKSTPPETLEDFARQNETAPERPQHMSSDEIMEEFLNRQKESAPAQDSSCIGAR